MLKYHLSYHHREIQKSNIKLFFFFFIVHIYFKYFNDVKCRYFDNQHQKALQLIKEEHSIRSAEAHIGLSRSAIFRAKKRCEKGDTSFGVSGRPSCMTKDEEALLRKRSCHI